MVPQRASVAGETDLLTLVRVVKVVATLRHEVDRAVVADDLLTDPEEVRELRDPLHQVERAAHRGLEVAQTDLHDPIGTGDHVADPGEAEADPGAAVHRHPRRAAVGASHAAAVHLPLNAAHDQRATPAREAARRGIG